MGFYEDFYERYKNADEKTKLQSLEHWKECHMKNVSDKRDDLILFSGKILATIYKADMETA